MFNDETLDSIDPDAKAQDSLTDLHMKFFGKYTILGKNTVVDLTKFSFDIVFLYIV